jgi:hypothetical protein
MSLEGGEGWREFRRAVEAMYFAEVMSATGQHQIHAALKAKVHRNTLGRVIRKRVAA